jgi:kynurenine aminotransferase
MSTVAGNHYSHPKGRIRLREAIRDHYSKDFNRTLNVEDEILVTSGANEGTRLVETPTSFHSCTIRPVFGLGCFP